MPVYARQIDADLSDHAYYGETAHTPAGLRLLVVDDVEDNRCLLKTILEKAGHGVLLAEGGAEAVALYQRQQPDIILMDVMMPVMDGYEAARLIKAQAGRRFVPIIFVTALTEDRQLAKCLEVGGDDFIVKPINRILLKAKLLAMWRQKSLYREYERQQRELQALHERLCYEHEVTEHVFARIIGNTSFDIANIRYELSPMAIVNGDLILATTTPVGNQLVLLGDFAGHGLSAAIGAIPVSGIFRAMAAKSLAIEEIVAEMNRKLYEYLPTGQFLAACLLEWNPQASTLRIWNGGMPDVLLISGEGESLVRMTSRNLSIGVVGDAEFIANIEVYDVKADDRIIAYSDGLIEARNIEGEMFGQERLERLINRRRGRDGLFAEIRNTVRRFRGEQPQNDDITLIEIRCDRNLLRGQDREKNNMNANLPRSATCRMTFSLRSSELADFDPMSVVNVLVNSVPALKPQQASLYMVVVELYVNALDHGVLKMDSSLKQSEEGFSRYYAEREERLTKIDEGWIKIDIECFVESEGGELRLFVADSGDGFDSLRVSPLHEGGEQPQGRGIRMVRALCESVMYNECGNEVNVVYRW